VLVYDLTAAAELGDPLADLVPAVHVVGRPVPLGHKPQLAAVIVLQVHGVIPRGIARIKSMSRLMATPPDLCFPLPRDQGGGFSAAWVMILRWGIFA
jgi:hypothetical protein